MFKVEIWVSFTVSFDSLSFSKTFNLPFPPFYDLAIQDNNKEIEHEIALSNTNYKTTYICYEVNQEKFYVDIRNHNKSISDESIQNIIANFLGTGWKIQNVPNTEIKDFIHNFDNSALNKK